VFCDAAITKAQLLYVFEGLSWFVVWLEGFFESLHKLLVSSPVRFVGFSFFTFFNFRLDELLFPDSSVSICQVGQNKGYLLLIVVVYESVYFEVDVNILHEQDEIALFPCKGFRWVKLDILRGFWCHRCGGNGFGHSFLLSVLSFGVEVLVSVSRCQVLSSQGLKVSVGQDFVVSRCRGAL
jgi:hypothetical protein